MNSYRHISASFQDEYRERSQALRDRLVLWRRGAPVIRVARPTNIARARSLGYKAKQGVVVVRVRVRRGLSKRPKPHRGRKPSKYGRFFALRKSLQSRAEDRAARMFANCEVLNSYYVGEDGTNKFFEVILLDRSHPAIASDRSFAGVIGQRNRGYRGLTSSGRKHRGIATKGFGTNISRPSVRQAQRSVKA